MKKEGFKCKSVLETNFNEDFLHYLWKYKMYDLVRLETVNNKKIQVLQSGTSNKNSGPDFFNGLLMVGNQKWAGNIEIHMKSSDWYVHNHELDASYDSVILHVVWEFDIPVFYPNQTEIPTVELRNFVSPKLIDFYFSLFSSSKKWILCQETIGETSPFILKSWLNRLYFERLEEKSVRVFYLLKASNNDWEAVLFQMLAKSFGMKLNGDVFLDLARSFDFSVFRKCQSKPGLLEILLLGQAGFYDGALEDEVYCSKKEEYTYIKKKYSLVGIDKKQFLFFRMRPNNFPTIKISQLAQLYQSNTQLFSELINIKTIQDYYRLFSVKTSVYWETHFVYGKESKIKRKQISKGFIDLLLLNVIIPLKYSYRKFQNITMFEDLETLVNQIKPENNSVINKYKDLGVRISSAIESQALLQMRTEYCTKKRCLECSIGLQLLRQKR